MEYYTAIKKRLLHTTWMNTYMSSRLWSQDTRGIPTSQPARAEPALPPDPETPLCPAGSLQADPPGPLSLPLLPAPFTEPAKRAESLSCSFTYPPDTSRQVKAKLKVKSLFTSGSLFSAAP